MKKGISITILSKITTVVSIMLLLLFSNSAKAITTKTCTTTGNWSTGSIWSPSGVPNDTDNVIINSGVTLTVDGDYTCRDLDLGSSANSSATVKIITSGHSLTVTGDLDVNPTNKNYTYLVDAGPGDMSFTGTFSHWGTTGNNKFQIGDGSISFTAAVAIADADQSIVFTGGGNVTFNSNFSDGYDNMTFYTGCTVNFYGNYTITGSDITWGTTGTANFYGTGTITDTKNIIMNTVNIMSSATTTLAAGAGTFTVNGAFTINSSGTFNMNDNFDLKGNLANNGGTISAGSVTITFIGTAQTISGTANLNLPSTTYTLPSADGTSGQALTTNGSGTLAWGSVASPTVIVAAARTSAYTTTSGYANVVYNTAATNVGSAYNTSTGVFTAPATGLYQIIVNNNYSFGNGANDGLTGRIIVGGVTDMETIISSAPYSSPTVGGGLVMTEYVQMTSGQTASIQVGNLIATVTPLVGTAQHQLRIIRIN